MLAILGFSKIIVMLCVNRPVVMQCFCTLLEHKVPVNYLAEGVEVCTVFKSFCVRVNTPQYSL